MVEYFSVWRGRFWRRKIGGLVRTKVDWSYEKIPINDSRYILSKNVSFIFPMKLQKKDEEFLVVSVFERVAL